VDPGDRRVHRHVRARHRRGRGRGDQSLRRRHSDHPRDRGDRAREGAAGLGAIGFAVGLFAPPLLAATAVGAAIGAGAGKVEPAVTRAVKKAVGEAEGHHVKALRGAIADAQQKMAASGA